MELFDVVLVNVCVSLVPLGVIRRPWAPQGTPQRGRVEKVMKKMVRGSSPGHSKFTKVSKKLRKIEGATASRFWHAFSMAKVSKVGGWLSPNHGKYCGFHGSSRFLNFMIFMISKRLGKSFFVILGALG